MYSNKKGMAINESNDSLNIQFLSPSYPEGFKSPAGNSRLPFEFQVPRKVLEERVKSWESLFEKYSMEITEAVELNLETLQPVTNTENEYVSEHRVPMRNSPACIQYWVDTGKPPCMAYVDENYNSGSETSLSETELSAPPPAASPPLKYISPHLPQPANIPHEVIKSGPSDVLSSSVDTRDYILSTNIAKKKGSLAIMGNFKSLEKVTEANVNIEDTYVDVCGTDDFPKIAERSSQKIEPNSVNSQNTTVVYPLANSQDTAIMRVATGSLKLGDVIPSLQRIRDGPENYNVSDVYSDKLASDQSDDAIEFGRNHSPIPTSSLKMERDINEKSAFSRRKLFTNRNSPIELTVPTRHISRRISSSSYIHPALQTFELLQNESKLTRKRKRSLFRKKLQLGDTGEGSKDNEIKGDHNQENNDDPRINDHKKGEQSSDPVINLDSKPESKTDEIIEEDLPLEKRIEGRIAPNIILKSGKILEAMGLKKEPEVRLKQVSESFIQRSRRKSVSKNNNKKNKKVSCKANPTKKGKAKDKETDVSYINATINNEFINKKGLKIRDLVVSLERLPVVILEKISHTDKIISKLRENSNKQTLSKETSPEEVLSKETLLIKSSSSGIKKVSVSVDSDDEESLDRNPRQELRKFSPAEKNFMIKTILHSSDEEEDIFMDLKKGKEIQNQKDLTNGQDAENEKLKETVVTRVTTVGTNSPLKFSREQSSLFKLSNNPENCSKSTTVVFTISSDEDDDFTKIIEKCFSTKRSKTSRNERKLSKTCNDNSKTEQIAQNGLSTGCGSFPVEELQMNGFKTNSSNINEDAIDEQTLNNLPTKMLVNTKTSNIYDNNLKQKSSIDDTDNKDSEETMNPNVNKFNPFEVTNIKSMSRYVVVSSSDSSDSDNNAEVLSKKLKRLEPKSAKRKVRLKQISESFIQRSRRKNVSKNNNRKSKKVSFKANPTKKGKAKNKKTDVPYIKAAVNNEFINKKELENRDQVVSLEQLPVGMLENISHKDTDTGKLRENSNKQTSAKETSSKVLSKETPLIESSSSGIKNSLEKSKMKVSVSVDSDDEKSLDRNPRQELGKFSPAEKNFMIKTILNSSDEEEDIFMDLKKEKEIHNQKDLTNGQDAENEKLKENVVTRVTTVGTNSPLKFSREQSSLFKLNNKPENCSKSTTVVFTISSDEDDDFTKIIEKCFSTERLQTSRNERKLSKTCNDNSKTKHIAQNGFSTSCGSFPVEEWNINGFKTNSSNINEDAIDEHILNNLPSKMLVNTETSNSYGNNLKQKSSKDVADNKDSEETMNPNVNKLNPFEVTNIRYMSKYGDDQSRDSLLNIFGDDSSRDSSPNIFGVNKNSVRKEGSGVKCQIFQTKSFWESDSG